MGLGHQAADPGGGHVGRMDLKKLVLVCAFGFLAAGCASADNQEAATANDPLEPMNRLFFDFNQRLDRHAALPAASFYTETVPLPARRGAHNFLSNLGGPVNVVNDLLETQFGNAGNAAARFLINSTIGVAGIFDVATDWGLPARDRDFGETLGVYGVPQGPYLVLPFRGPTAVRDLGGNYIDGFFSPLYYWHVQYTGKQYIGLVKSTIGSVDNRANNIVTYQDIERASVDFYATMRAYYRQRRQRQVEDKSAPTAELPDF
jgi:phospholipid-binding lipoprotein MlaA